MGRGNTAGKIPSNTVGGVALESGFAAKTAELRSHVAALDESYAAFMNYLKNDLGIKKTGDADQDREILGPLYLRVDEPEKEPDHAKEWFMDFIANKGLALKTYLESKYSPLVQLASDVKASQSQQEFFSRLREGLEIHEGMKNTPTLQEVGAFSFGGKVPAWSIFSAMERLIKQANIPEDKAALKPIALEKLAQVRSDLYQLRTDMDGLYAEVERNAARFQPAAGAGR